MRVSVLSGCSSTLIRMTQQDVSGKRAPSEVEPERRRVTQVAGIEIPPTLDWVLALARVDSTPRHRQPSVPRVVIATCIAVVVALVADALIVALGTHVFPSTVGYGHFRFNDYAKLTIIGVSIGCIGWPMVTRISSTPRWLYGWLTVLATLVLFAPDAWLLLRGQPLNAVAVLMAMHVAVALVIYVVMLTIAPIPKGGYRGGVTTLR